MTRIQGKHLFRFWIWETSPNAMRTGGSNMDIRQSRQMHYWVKRICSPPNPFSGRSNAKNGVCFSDRMLSIINLANAIFIDYLKQNNIQCPYKHGSTERVCIQNICTYICTSAQELAKKFIKIIQWAWVKELGYLEELTRGDGASRALAEVITEIWSTSVIAEVEGTELSSGNLAASKFSVHFLRN
jgi:hypothetical protein